MGWGLYHSEPAFCAAYDECCEILESYGSGDPRDLLFSEDPQALVPTSVTQPAISQGLGAGNSCAKSRSRGRLGSVGARSSTSTRWVLARRSGWKSPLYWGPFSSRS
jgi:hypothetical protein